jgi:ribosomal-protein-alanine N-acetyltransferase
MPRRWRQHTCEIQRAGEQACRLNSMLQPPPPLYLRPLHLADLPAVLLIEQQSFPTPTKEKTYRIELSANKLAHYQALMLRTAKQEEQLLGYAGYWLIADEIHISTIAVDPQWRGHGLGELILLNIIHLGYKHGAATVTLEVRVSNLVAQDLYRKYEFEQVGRRKRYYKDTGEDALLMTAALRSNQQYRPFLEQKQEQLYGRLASTPF